MKTKKLLPLVLLAVAAVLMLSSCDAMLDAIFPTNQIIVDVAVDALPGHHLDFATSPVTVVLSGPTPATGTKYFDGYDIYNYAHYTFSFTNLKDGFYTINAYYYGAIPASAGTFISMPDHSPFNPDSSGRSTTVSITIP
ncbi:MAG: hypothetical protein ABSB63_06820 [Spirochaetia bacterium]|jgi:hypothetical protein